MKSIQRFHIGVGFATLLLIGSVARASGPSLQTVSGLVGSGKQSTARLERALPSSPTPSPSESNPGVLPPGSRPYGASYGEWGARFWQWVLGIPFDTSPIQDATGASCGLEQSGPVWFLAGTSGSAVSRACTVPAGKAIFFPLVNFINDYPCPDPGFQPAPGQSMEDFLAEGAAFFIDHTTELEAELDGVALQNLFGHRARSPLFDFSGDISNQAFDPCITGSSQPAVTDGYWVMLAPLHAGEHTLHFRGRLDFPEFDFSFEVEVTYDLSVAPARRGRREITSAPDAPQAGTWGMVKNLYR